MTKKVLVAIADGSEEMESVTIIDILRRAGADLTVASVQEKQITASRGVKIVADKLIDECVGETFDLIVLPGGMPGATNLKNSEALKKMLLRQNEEGRKYGAICASPAVILESHGLLDGKKATCYPGMPSDKGLDYLTDAAVVTDGNCITSQGPGTAVEFSLSLAGALYGSDKVNELKKEMLIP